MSITKPHASLLAVCPLTVPILPLSASAFRYETVQAATIVAVVPVEICLLGAPAVRRDGEPVSFDTRKAIALLADLALAERPRSRDSLCGLLWPGHDSERARGALRRTLWTLRNAIGKEWIETAGDTIQLRVGEGLETDVARFRALAGEAAPAEDLERAVTAFAGEFLEGFSLRDSPEFDDWQMFEADGLRRELAGALARLVELLAAGGEYERALPYAERWLEVDPVHEPAHRQLIRLYALNGDRAAALAQYRECVRTLSRELGVAPLEDTVALYEQVNQGALAPPPGAVPRTAVGKGAAEAPRELPLVGRDDELEALVAAHAGASPDGRLAVIEGEAGIGKTRLAQELVARGRAAGAVVLASRCHDDEAGLAYGAVVELLREALRGGRLAESDELTPQRLGDASLLLPELASLAINVPAPPPLSGPLAQIRLLEGIAAVIGAACRGPRPGIVVLDDVHAADQATLDAISYLGLRLRGRPLLLVLVWRSEGVPPGHRLRRLAADLARDGRTTIVSPARLDEQQVSELVRAMRDAEPARELERRVYLESEGLPLFVAEYLAALRAGEGAEESLPGEVRSLLGARLGNLSEVARQVLGAAAVVGRSFELDTVREVSGRSDEEAVTALEELVAQGVVRELTGAEPAYDFWHEKLRALVYEQMTQSRRRLLHARVAATLGKGRPRDGSAALIASHLHLAGDQAGAAQQHYRAAQHAASLHAYIDALEHLEAALALGYPDPARLLEWVGDLRTLVGNYGGALAAYESAAAEGGPIAWRSSSIESATSISAAANGSGPRRTSPARSKRFLRPRRPAGAHHRGLGPGRAPHRPAPASSDPRARSTGAGRGGGRPSPAGPGTQHARHARPPRGDARRRRGGAGPQPGPGAGAGRRAGAGGRAQQPGARPSRRG